MSLWNVSAEVSISAAICLKIVGFGVRWTVSVPLAICELSVRSPKGLHAYHSGPIW